MGLQNDVIVENYDSHTFSDFTTGQNQVYENRFFLKAYKLKSYSN